MKGLLDLFVMGIYLFALAFGGKFALSKMENFTRKLALEKASQGLSNMEHIARKLTGKKNNF